MQVDVSLIIPAFNEAKRLPLYLEMVRRNAEEPWAGCVYEVIVADDGSSDGLPDMLAEWISSWPALRVIRHLCNRGKGAALHTGMLEASGDLVLLADADGATPIELEAMLRRVMEDGADIAIGSRAAWGRRSWLSADSGGQECPPSVERTWRRRLTGSLFAWLVRRMFGLPIRDTQCGFKMFKGDVAKRLFALCKGGFLIAADVPVALQDLPGPLPLVPHRRRSCDELIAPRLL